MTDALYYHDFEEQTAGTVGPEERTPTIHPAMLPADRVLRIVGSVWSAHEQPDGRWSFKANGETIWGPMTGTVEDAFRLLLDVHRDPSPRAETQGHPVPDSDPLAPARGILLATGIMACVYTAVFVVLRWRGVL